MVEPPPTPGAGAGVESDYSAANTLIHFEHPIPLLRGPIPAGSADDPSRGPYLLAFRDPQSFHFGRRFCESKLLEQCEAGVRIGCSVAASSKCRPPWWKLLLGGSRTDFKYREKCEEREMVLCVEASKQKCESFAKDKCKAAFGSARVAVAREWKVREREVARLIGWVSSWKWEEGDVGLRAAALSELGSVDPSKMVYQVTNIRGCDLLGGGECNQK